MEKGDFSPQDVKMGKGQALERIQTNPRTLTSVQAMLPPPLPVPKRMASLSAGHNVSFSVSGHCLSLCPKQESDGILKKEARDYVRFEC